MSEQHIEVEGRVTVVLPGTMFRVELDNKHVVLATICGKMRKRWVRLTVGDRVKMEISPYDLEQGANHLAPEIVVRASILHSKPRGSNQTPLPLPQSKLKNCPVKPKWPTILNRPIASFLAAVWAARVVAKIAPRLDFFVQ